MTDPRLRALLAPAAALMMASTALVACERRPYPEPSLAEPPPMAPPPELLGAPEGRDGRPLPAPEAAPPPEGQLQPAPEGPGDSAAPPPPYAGQERPRAEGAYPPSPEPFRMAPIPNPEDGGVRHRRPAAEGYVRAEGIVPPRADRVIAGTPVPNPDERRPARARVHAHVEGRPAAATPPRRVHLHLRPARPAHPDRHHAMALRPEHKHSAARQAAGGGLHPAHVVAHPTERPATAHKPVAPHAPAKAQTPHVGPAPAKASAHPAAPARPKPAAAVAAQANPAARPQVVPAKPAEVIKPDLPKALVKPAIPTLQAPAKADVTPSKAGEANGRRHGKLTGRTPSAAPSAEESARLSAISGALTPVIAARASLRGAESLRPGAPGDVSLTVPQDFAEGLKSEAQRGGLADAAASTALTARLAGEGYAVSPADAQSQPLTAGKPTEFRWTVTRMDAAKGPLTAEVGADLLGGGKQHLDLGTLTASQSRRGGVSPKAIGVGILALIAVLVGFIMMGGRRREDAPPAA